MGIFNGIIFIISMCKRYMDKMNQNKKWPINDMDKMRGYFMRFIYIQPTNTDQWSCRVKSSPESMVFTCFVYPKYSRVPGDFTFKPW